MSDVYPNASGYPDPVLPASESESCLVLVTSHLGAAPLVESVTTEARRRVMASPMLGAFIDLRFMHLGPQPGRGGEQSQALARITSQLLQPRIGIARGFFAVVVLDRSAATTEAVLRDCARSPFLDKLPLRLLGIASQEDRRKDRVPEGAELLVSAHGAWRREELVGEIRRYADRLLNELASGQQHGVTPAELAEYRDRYEAHAGRERAVIPRAGVPTTGGFPAISATGGFPVVASTGSPVGGSPAIPATTPPAQDALDPGAPGSPDRLAQLWLAPAQQLSAPAQQLQQSQPPGQGQQAMLPQATAPGTVDAASPAQSLPPAQPTQPPGAYAWPAVTPGEAREPSGRLLSRLSRRLLPEVRWRRTSDASEGQAQQPPPTASGLAYLILTGDERSGDLAEWSRSRAMLLAVDKKFAALPGIACQVRVLRGDENGLRGDLREAGELGKRDVRGSVADLYFSDVLDEIRKMLGRDRARYTAAALPLRRPVVAFFAPQPPLADSGAVRSFRALTQEASIAWVVPKRESDMMADDFTSGGRLLTDFESLADDLAELLTQDDLDRTDPDPVVPIGRDGGRATG